MKLDANVAKWAVNVIQLSKIKRHLDRAALMTFWEKLDSYVTYLNALIQIIFQIQRCCFISGILQNKSRIFVIESSIESTNTLFNFLCIRHIFPTSHLNEN